MRERGVRSPLRGACGVPAHVAAGATLPPRAPQVLRRGCDAADHGACLSLANMLDHGIGARPDPVTARRLLEPLCGMEPSWQAVSACQHLGNLYEHGRGVPRDVVRTMKLLERVCRMDARACVRLGALQQAGTFAEADRAAARRSFQRSCEAGIPAACDALAELGETED